MPPPETTEVVGVSYGEWTEDTYFDGGCCHPTRLVTVDVESAATDPWAYVELMGQFAGPSQITEDLVRQRLVVGIGPGAHRLTYQQWDDDGELQPSAFTVGHVASNGIRGETMDVDGGPGRACASGCDSGSDSGSDPRVDADTAATTCAGCATAPSTGLLLVLLAPWWTRLRAHP